MNLIKAFFIWSLIIPLAIFNGWIRETFLTVQFGHYALPLSGILLCVGILMIAIICLPFLEKGHSMYYIYVGLYWVILTVCFEFMMGIFIMKKPFSELLSAYDVTTGNLWLFVVITVGFAPLIAAKIRHLL